MHIAVKIVVATLATALIAVGGYATWHVRTKLPVREGSLQLKQLRAPVSVAYDERGVPHIKAESEMDMYRALGYVHAQDRLFQMEMVRRLSRGELADILGPKLLETDKLFRTMGIRARADELAAKVNPVNPVDMALLSYLDGINQYQNTHPSPLEFDILKIPKRPFTPQDTYAVAGYLAYSFAAGLRTDAPLTHIRDELGPDYLRIFDLEWHPEGVIDQSAFFSPAKRPALALTPKDWKNLDQLATLSYSALEAAGVPTFEGSNAWAISGKRTASGKPMLAGDPHIAYSAPAVWYEAHLSAPGYEMYGHFQSLIPVAMLGHNTRFGWSLTMFENDDMDLVAEKPNPANPNQVSIGGQWVDLQARIETIKVKGAADVQIKLRRSPHGPIITDVFKDNFGDKPIAMWWAFLETENPIMQAFYELNRADTREKARTAAEKIHSPGLNVVWANAAGDIGWWAAAKLPIRPAGVNPSFILDGSTGEADKTGFYSFNFNPQEENPARGYIVSANHQPQPASGVPVPGYYNLADRAQRLDAALRDPDRKWDTQASQNLQLDGGNGYGPRILKDLMPILMGVTTDPYEKAFLEPLTLWDGDYSRDSMAALLFTQLMYELAHAAMADEMGEVQFKNLLKTFALDSALPVLAADANSPWWDNIKTKKVENRFETVRVAWVNTIKHLETMYGKDLLKWRWGNAHTLTHVHPLGMQKPLDKIFNVGPFNVAGGRETPNNMNVNMGPGPWPVKSGPSTRRVIDFARPDKSVGINPVGQSGVLFDKHYDDQAALFSEGLYMQQYFSAADIKAHTKSTLTLRP
ncbi:MAG TPA: penicillin acylase family protein [Rhodoferax sp.]|nr:penicillin acylase family protein [Rhodoferax sp.]